MLKESDNFTAVLMVLFINMVVFIPISLIVMQSKENVQWTGFSYFLLAGLFGALLGKLFHYYGIKTIGSSKTEPLKATQPLFAAILAAAFLGEVITPIYTVGILAIVIGVGFVSWETHRLKGGENQSAKYTLVNLSFPLLAAFFYGLAPIFGKTGLDLGVSPYTGVAVRSITAFFGLAGFLLLARHKIKISSGEIKFLVSAGIFNSIGMLFYYLGFQIGRVTIVVPMVSLAPLFVTLWSWLFLKGIEKITLVLVAGTAVTVAGVVIISVL